jgi:hypothetical protein
MIDSMMQSKMPPTMIARRIPVGRGCALTSVACGKNGQRRVGSQPG